jgi:acyl-CoA oxidase
LQIHNVENATDPAQSSAILRRLVKSGLLKYTDMRDAPEKFFLGHRLLSTVGLGGFGIRFTVQYNLFAGSILGLAGNEQIKMLGPLQEEGLLGCFLLVCSIAHAAHAAHVQVYLFSFSSF